MAKKHTAAKGLGNFLKDNWAYVAAGVAVIVLLIVHANSVAAMQAAAAAQPAFDTSLPTEKTSGGGGGGNTGKWIRVLTQAAYTTTNKAGKKVHHPAKYTEEWV